MKKIIKRVIMLLLLTMLFCGCEYFESDLEQLPEMHMVTITLDYEEVMLTSNTPMNLYVNGEKLGRQEAGTIEQYMIPLEEGDYRFYLKNDGIYKSEEIPFTVTASDTEFDFGAKTRLTIGVKVWQK